MEEQDQCWLKSRGLMFLDVIMPGPPEVGKDIQGVQEIIQHMPTQQERATVEAKGFLCNLPSLHTPVNRQVSASAFHLHRTLASFET